LRDIVLYEKEDDIVRIVLKILKRTANTIIQKDHIALKWAKKLINENQEEPIETVLDEELRVMILTGQSADLKKRLEKFVKDKR
jgi:enoyl-CoA hydratase/carnithine racemase